MSLTVVILSGIGLIICSYLTIIHYFTDGAGAYCGAGWDCDAVLNSRFSKLFGVPASLAGVLGYGILIVAGARGGLEKNRSLTIGTASAGLGISIYLSWAEFFVIKQTCPFCVASALIILAIWIVSVRGAPLSSIAAGVVIAVAAAGGGYASAVLGEPFARQEQSRSSGRGDFQRNLAEHLAKKGAVMYGSFKCPACIVQKQYFGKHAGKLNYVECHPEGKNADPQLCSQKKIRAYPTWDIGGSFHKGAMTLEKLSKLSGYEKTPVVK